jgi:malonyl CoA-acyl carrier protein transacylase
MTTTASPAARRPAPAAPASGWDTEVLVLRGDDRARLRERVLALARYLDARPDAPLPDLAAALARGLAPGGCRLAVVAGSAADLRARLARAADRLADPACARIRDAAGLYYFDQPLFTQGTLALLFPGEGAQYLDMLADLCGVLPEVEETFAWCDRLAAEAGRPEESLRRLLHLPPGATAEERAAAETRLRQLGPSIFGVLLADLAIARVLNNLHVPVSAVAGHSAGELAALLAAGAMQSEAVLGPRLAEIMDLMQRVEGETGGADVALLAVGAGKPAVEEAAAAVACGAVVVAMDNCPHQSVAVGPAHLVAAVEALLTERGVLCERLPFRRPYHTPLFEPWMGPFRDLFAGVPFAVPHTPVYCCSTGRRFPDDPEAIRRLAVDHWVTPVEFTAMIEAMYADGVRLFVEAGPRGNLSAFVEDILRGRPFAALPANVTRKSGPTQLNHLLAQLAAHHVPLNLGHLYAGRVAADLDWERDTDDRTVFPLSPRAGEVPEVGALLPFPPNGSGNHTAVLDAYLGTMEQFLDVQRAVMEAYLAGRSAPADLPPELLAFPDLAPPSESSVLSPQSSVPDAQSPSRPFALVGEVVHHVPGHEVIFRRVMDEREDLYAADHTLGGRGVSRVDPGQNGLPVLPMTFSLEAMAEAAALLVPGKVVVAIRNVRLHRWLPFDPEPTTLEVRAAVVSADPATGAVEVRADVRDLGNSFARDAANRPASEAVVVLADRYPDPPGPRPFPLTDEQPCRCSVEDLRRNMFHGPLFQMVRELARTGKEGIEGAIEVRPRAGWFRSDPDPNVVLDPVLIDAAMHVLGAWHLEQPDWTGRILLPFEVARVEFFGPPPPAGSRLAVRGHNEQESARHYRHGLEVFTPDGRLWLRMTGAGYWRFYLPFGHVNFFGPKDEYFLSRDWPEAVPPRGNGPPRRCHFLDPPVDLKQPVLRAAGARVTMTPRELAGFHAWAGTDAELNDWFFGRMLAKDAVRAAWAEKYGERLFPADIETEAGPDGRLAARPRGAPGPEPLPPVAVAVADGKVAAVSAFARHVGIALVKLPAPDADESAARVLAARRAAADALRTAEEAIEVRPAGPGSFVASAGGVSLRIQTARRADLVVATALSEPDPA